MIKEIIEMLGVKASDKVTGFSGVVTSVGFDLYGCVQVALTPPVNDKGEKGDGHWFDANRLEVSDQRVMPVPDFDAVVKPKDYAKGPAEKNLSGARGV